MSMRFVLCFMLATAVSWCAPVSVQSQPTGQMQILTPQATNGSFIIGVSAPLGRSYFVQAATNLTAWQVIGSNTVTDTILITNANAPQFGRRFFRGGFYWTLLLPNPYLLFLTASGRDGRVIAYPYNWTTNQGRDGRLIAYPSGWTTNQGRDGRLIAFPSGWTNVIGPDGRDVPFPATGFTTATGTDGRLTVHPTPGLPGAGPNSYVTANWKTVTGADGRLVTYPAGSFSTNQGGDGRLVAYESAGWNTNRGNDARTIAYSAADFTTAKGLDGRIIAYPSSGWATTAGVDGRVIAFPTINLPFIELDFEDQQFFAFLGHLRTVAPDPDFEDFIIYTWFGTGEQRTFD